MSLNPGPYTCGECKDVVDVDFYEFMNSCVECHVWLCDECVEKRLPCDVSDYGAHRPFYSEDADNYAGDGVFADNH